MDEKIINKKVIFNYHAYAPQRMLENITGTIIENYFDKYLILLDEPITYSMGIVKFNLKAIYVCKKQVKIMQVQVDLKSLVETVANDLLKANNTVTTLEVKTELRNKYKEFYWTQKIVSDYMDELFKEGKFTFKDGGAFRVYSSVKNQVKFVAVPVAPVAQKPGKLSRKKALEMMKNNKGHFFTVTFFKKDGTLRTMNCQYLKDQDQIELGYVKVKEASKAKQGVNAIRNINLQTLKTIRIAGNTYTIK